MSNSTKDEDLMKKDLYKLLEVDSTATNDEINKGYKKLARKYHPDKNPDNLEEAKRMFNLIKKASEFLQDLGKRAEYDHKLKAKQLDKERYNQLDAKKRKLLDDLVAREKRHAEDEEVETKKRKEEEKIERLREENRRWVEEENQKLFEEERKTRNVLVQPCVLKVKWERREVDSQYVYTKSSLKSIFSKYSSDGRITVVIKDRHALIQFKNTKDAILAKSAKGFPQNRFKSVTFEEGNPFEEDRNENKPKDHRNNEYYNSYQSSEFMTNPDDLEQNEAEMFAMFEKMQEEEKSRGIKKEEKNSMNQSCILKVKWSTKKVDSQFIYSESSLKNIFAKYSSDSKVAVVMKKKKALVEFSSYEDAKSAVDEKGFHQNPFKSVNMLDNNSEQE